MRCARRRLNAARSGPRSSGATRRRCWRASAACGAPSASWHSRAPPSSCSARRASPASSDSDARYARRTSGGACGRCAGRARRGPSEAADIAAEERADSHMCAAAGSASRRSQWFRRGYYVAYLQRFCRVVGQEAARGEKRPGGAPARPQRGRLVARRLCPCCTDFSVVVASIGGGALPLASTPSRESRERRRGARPARSTQAAGLARAAPKARARRA